MTHNELRWAQSQSWWNDFTNIFSRLSETYDICQYLETVPFELMAINIIGHSKLNDTDNIILIRIANACLDHMEDLPGLGEYSKPVISTTKKSEVRKFSYSSQEEKVAEVHSDTILTDLEKEALYKELKSRNLVWDNVVSDDRNFQFYKTTKVLEEL